MSASFRDWVQELKGRLREVDPEEAARRLDARPAPLLLDVRERDEWEQGHLPGATHLSRGFLELKIEGVEPDRSRPLLVYCAGGTRSLLAAEALGRLGYADVASLRGGFTAWKEQGRPCVKPEALTAPERQRYARHLILPEVGEPGQLKLRAARVLLVGAGGLGSPAALYLAAAGVGTLGIVDDDVVDASNLQRQVLHAEERIGQRKVDSAEATLRSVNSRVEVRKFAERLTRENADRIVPEFDVVLDGADNFATRYLVNDACVKHGKPNVHGSVHRFEGQVSVFHAGKGPCYRCLFPVPPPPELAPSCAEAGVLGVLPGVVGMLEAVETLKLLLGVGEPLVGRLLVYDALATTFRELRVRADPACAVCRPGIPFPGYVDYDAFCAAACASTGRSSQISR